MSEPANSAVPFKRLDGHRTDRRKSEALLSASETFCQRERPSRMQIEEFKELFYSLIAYADERTRRSVAKAVVDCDYTPRAVLLFLAIDDPAIAAPVLAGSRALGQFDLMQVIDKKGAVHHRVIANREDVGPSVVAKLISLNDRLVAQRLLDNEAAVFSVDQRVELEAITSDSEAASEEKISAELDLQLLTDSLKTDVRSEEVAQEPLPIADETDEFETADAAEEAIFAAAGQISAQLTAELKDLAKRAGKSLLPSEEGEQEQPQTAEAFHAAFGEAASKNHRQDQTTALQSYFGLSRETCHSLFEDGFGDKLAIALKASDMPEHQATSAIMLALPAVGLSFHNMRRIRDIYESLSPVDCRETVNQWLEQDTERQRKSQHVPVVSSDGAPDTRLAGQWRSLNPSEKSASADARLTGSH
ncbi:MAG: DUF2336 domain-containing protein [Pseudomonadota bacterium]